MQNICGTTALNGFTEVGATGETNAAAAALLEGTWKSGCIVVEDSHFEFHADNMDPANSNRITIGLAGLLALEPGTYTIPQDIPEVTFLAKTASATPDPSPVTFSATSGTFTIDSVDDSMVSGTFDNLTGFTNGYVGNDITINFSLVKQDGTTGAHSPSRKAVTLVPTTSEPTRFRT